MSTDPLYLIYIDGASSGNPGPAGIGIVIYQNKKKVDTISKRIGKATNNTAEYKALLAALMYAKKNILKNIKIYSDSLLVIKQINGEYLVRDDNLKRLHKDAIKLLKGFSKWEINHISSKENKEANKLAHFAAKKEPKRASNKREE